MSLEIYYNRPYQIYEPENLQNIVIKYIIRKIKWRYPKKLITDIFYKHVNMFVPYTSECEYQLDYRAIDKPYGVAIIYIDPLIKPNKKIKESEKDGYKFYKIDKLTITTYKTFRKFNPIFYRDHIPKSMFINKILQLIDKDINNFKHWGCDFSCLEEPWKCRNTNPVNKNVC